MSWQRSDGTVWRGVQVWMTLSQIIHGASGGCSRRRRVIFPWLVAVESDGRKLEVTEWGDLKDISRALACFNIVQYWFFRSRTLWDFKE